MNRLLSSRAEKNRLLDFLRKVLIELLLPTIPPDQREIILNYLAWMKDQSAPMFIRTDCRTEPAFKSIKITIEASFEETEGMTRQ